MADFFENMAKLALGLAEVVEPLLISKFATYPEGRWADTAEGYWSSINPPETALSANESAPALPAYFSPAPPFPQTRQVVAVGEEPLAPLGFHPEQPEKKKIIFSSETPNFEVPTRFSKSPATGLNPWRGHLFSLPDTGRTVETTPPDDFEKGATARWNQGTPHPFPGKVPTHLGRTTRDVNRYSPPGNREHRQYPENYREVSQSNPGAPGASPVQDFTTTGCNPWGTDIGPKPVPSNQAATPQSRSGDKEPRRNPWVSRLTNHQTSVPGGPVAGREFRISEKNCSVGQIAAETGSQTSPPFQVWNSTPPTAPEGPANQAAGSFINGAQTGFAAPSEGFSQVGWPVLEGRMFAKFTNRDLPAPNQFGTETRAKPGWNQPPRHFQPHLGRNDFPVEAPAGRSGKPGLISGRNERRVQAPGANLPDPEWGNSSGLEGTAATPPETLGNETQSDFSAPFTGFLKKGDRSFGTRATARPVGNSQPDSTELFAQDEAFGPSAIQSNSLSGESCSQITQPRDVTKGLGDLEPFTRSTVLSVEQPQPRESEPSNRQIAVQPNQEPAVPAESSRQTALTHRLTPSADEIPISAVGNPPLLSRNQVGGFHSLPWPGETPFTAATETQKPREHSLPPAAGFVDPGAVEPATRVAPGPASAELKSGSVSDAWFGRNPGHPLLAEPKATVRPARSGPPGCENPAEAGSNPVLASFPRLPEAWPAGLSGPVERLESPSGNDPEPSTVARKVPPVGSELENSEPRAEPPKVRLFGSPHRQLGEPGRNNQLTPAPCQPPGATEISPLRSSTRSFRNESRGMNLAPPPPAPASFNPSGPKQAAAREIGQLPPDFAFFPPATPLEVGHPVRKDPAEKPDLSFTVLATPVAKAPPASPWTNPKQPGPTENQTDALGVRPTSTDPLPVFRGVSRESGPLTVVSENPVPGTEPALSGLVTLLGTGEKTAISRPEPGLDQPGEIQVSKAEIPGLRSSFSKGRTGKASVAPPRQLCTLGVRKFFQTGPTVESKNKPPAQITQEKTGPNSRPAAPPAVFEKAGVSQIPAGSVAGKPPTDGFLRATTPPPEMVTTLAGQQPLHPDLPPVSPENRRTQSLWSQTGIEEHLGFPPSTTLPGEANREKRPAQRRFRKGTSVSFPETGFQVRCVRTVRPSGTGKRHRGGKQIGKTGKGPLLQLVIPARAEPVSNLLSLRNNPPPEPFGTISWHLQQNRDFHPRPLSGPLNQATTIDSTASRAFPPEPVPGFNEPVGQGSLKPDSDAEPNPPTPSQRQSIDFGRSDNPAQSGFMVGDSRPGLPRWWKSPPNQVHSGKVSRPKDEPEAPAFWQPCPETASEFSLSPEAREPFPATEAEPATISKTRPSNVQAGRPASPFIQTPGTSATEPEPNPVQCNPRGADLPDFQSPVKVPASNESRESENRFPPQAPVEFLWQKNSQPDTLPQVPAQPEELVPVNLARRNPNSRIGKTGPSSVWASAKPGQQAPTVPRVNQFSGNALTLGMEPGPVLHSGFPPADFLIGQPHSVCPPKPETGQGEPFSPRFSFPGRQAKEFQQTVGVSGKIPDLTDGESSGPSAPASRPSASFVREAQTGLELPLGGFPPPPLASPVPAGRAKPWHSNPGMTGIAGAFQGKPPEMLVERLGPEPSSLAGKPITWGTVPALTVNETPEPARNQSKVEMKSLVWPAEAGFPAKLSAPGSNKNQLFQIWNSSAPPGSHGTVCQPPGSHVNQAQPGFKPPSEGFPPTAGPVLEGRTMANLASRESPNKPRQGAELHQLAELWKMTEVTTPDPTDTAERIKSEWMPAMESRPAGTPTAEAGFAGEKIHPAGNEIRSWLHLGRRLLKRMGHPGTRESQPAPESKATNPACVPENRERGPEPGKPLGETGDTPRECLSQPQTTLTTPPQPGFPGLVENIFRDHSIPPQPSAGGTRAGQTLRFVPLLSTESPIDESRMEKPAARPVPVGKIEPLQPSIWPVGDRAQRQPLVSLSPKAGFEAGSHPDFRNRLNRTNEENQTSPRSHAGGPFFKSGNQLQPDRAGNPVHQPGQWESPPENTIGGKVPADVRLFYQGEPNSQSLNFSRNQKPFARLAGRFGYGKAGRSTLAKTRPKGAKEAASPGPLKPKRNPVRETGPRPQPARPAETKGKPLQVLLDAIAFQVLAGKNKKPAGSHSVHPTLEPNEINFLTGEARSFRGTSTRKNQAKPSKTTAIPLPLGGEEWEKPNDQVPPSFRWSREVPGAKAGKEPLNQNPAATAKQTGPGLWDNVRPAPVTFSWNFKPDWTSNFPHRPGFDFSGQRLEQPVVWPPGSSRVTTFETGNQPVHWPDRGPAAGKKIPERLFDPPTSTPFRFLPWGLIPNGEEASEPVKGVVHAGDFHLPGTKPKPSILPENDGELVGGGSTQPGGDVFWGKQNPIQCRFATVPAGSWPEGKNVGWESAAPAPVPPGSFPSTPIAVPQPADSKQPWSPWRSRNPLSNREFHPEAAPKPGGQTISPMTPPINWGAPPNSQVCETGVNFSPGPRGNVFGVTGEPLAAAKSPPDRSGSSGSGTLHWGPIEAVTPAFPVQNSNPKVTFPEIPAPLVSSLPVSEPKPAAQGGILSPRVSREVTWAERLSLPGAKPVSGPGAGSQTVHSQTAFSPPGGQAPIDSVSETTGKVEHPFHPASERPESGPFRVFPTVWGKESGLHPPVGPRSQDVSESVVPNPLVWKRAETKPVSTGVAEFNRRENPVPAEPWVPKNQPVSTAASIVSAQPETEPPAIRPDWENHAAAPGPNPFTLPAESVFRWSGPGGSEGSNQIGTPPGPRQPIQAFWDQGSLSLIRPASTAVPSGPERESRPGFPLTPTGSVLKSFQTEGGWETQNQQPHQTGKPAGVLPPFQNQAEPKSRWIEKGVTGNRETGPLAQPDRNRVVPNPSVEPTESVRDAHPAAISTEPKNGTARTQPAQPKPIEPAQESFPNRVNPVPLEVASPVGEAVPLPLVRQESNPSPGNPRAAESNNPAAAPVAPGELRPTGAEPQTRPKPGPAEPPSPAEEVRIVPPRLPVRSNRGAGKPALDRPVRINIGRIRVQALQPPPPPPKPARFRPLMTLEEYLRNRGGR